MRRSAGSHVDLGRTGPSRVVAKKAWRKFRAGQQEAWLVLAAAPVAQ